METKEIVGVVIGLVVLILMFILNALAATEITDKKWEDVLVCKGYGEYTVENCKKVFKLKEIKNGSSN